MKITWLLLLLCLAETAVVAKAQSPRIYSLHIRTDIQFRFATTLITSRVANPANYSQETVFEVILPEEAFISNFTLEIDGKVYPGIVKDKDVAKKDYERAKKKGQTTGLVSQKPRDSRKFKVKVTVAASSKSTFSLTYQELLKRVKGAYEHKIFVSPGYPVDDLQISVAILESRNLTKVLVPPIRALNELLSQGKEIKENALASITRPSPKSAYITFSPTVDDQSDGGVSGQFIVQYDIDRSLDGGDILVVNGYFVHFVAPDVQTAIPKDVLFVIDVSGSMSGRKIEQLKGAMYVVLDQLKEGDRFNIVTFSGDIRPYHTEMIDVTTDEVFKAKEFTKTIRANGWTDINGAVLRGIDLLKISEQEGERSPVVIFLTDGHPSTGVTDSLQILKNIDSANEGEIPIFSLAFGKGADWDLVKKMAIQNDGVGRKIYEDSDSDLQISGFYDELAVTLLNNVSVKYLGDAVDDETLTKSEFKNYFKGSELVVAGKLTDAEAPIVDLEIFSNSRDGALILSLDKDANFIDVPDSGNLMKHTDFQEITEKTWAYLTIKQLLNRAEGELNETAVDVMKSRAKQLSLQYGFVTPLTSMVVTKPEVDPDKRTRTEDATASDRSKSNKLVRAGTKPKYSADNDPHFIVHVKGLDDAICFDVMGEEGDVFRLLIDNYSGLTVNGKVVANKKAAKKTNVLNHSKTGDIKTFLGEIRIERQQFEIIVTPTNITLQSETTDWLKGNTFNYGDTQVTVNKAGTKVVVKFDDGITFLIMRHLKSKSLIRAGKVNFLGLYILEHEGLSYHTHGLIGQFLHRTVHLKKTKTRNGKFMGQLRVSGNTQKPRRLMATLSRRLNLASNTTVSCWMVQHNGGALLDGNITDYLIE